MSCPVCLNAVTSPALAGRDTLFGITSKSFTLNSCAACRCLFLNPMPSADEIAGFYPHNYWWSSSAGGKRSALKALERFYRKLALRDHVAFILKAAGGRLGLELLDIGCGSGTLIGLLERRGFRVTGLDVSEEAARTAAEENGVRVLVGTLEQARLETGAFDVVTLFHVMEHVTNPRIVLNEVSRILRPGGSVVLQVPNIDSWQFRAFGAKWYGLDIPRHVIDYSKDSIVRLLEAAGFRVVRMKHFNLRDNAPALVSSLFPSLDPLSRAVRRESGARPESTALSWARHLAYLFLVVCAYPPAILESSFGRGATLMIEARRS